MPEPLRKSFGRLLVLLVGYGAGAALGLVAITIILVFAGSLGMSIAHGLGGSVPAKFLGYAVALVILLGVEIAFGFLIGWLFAAIIRLWPENPISKVWDWANNEKNPN